MDASDNRKIVHRFRVQAGLNVAVEDSMNILLEVTRPGGGEVIVRSDILGNIDNLKNALDLARVWVAKAGEVSEVKRFEPLWAKERNRKGLHGERTQTA